MGHPLSELAVLLRADLRSLRHRALAGSWGERLAAAAALLVTALFSWGLYRFFLRIFGSIRELGTLEAMALLPAALQALTGQLLAMAALTALAALLASSLVTGLSAAVHSRDLPELLALPVSSPALYLHRLLRSALAAGVPILLFLLPTALALGRVWGRPGRVLLLAAASGALLVLGTAAAGMALVLLLLRLFPAGRAAQTITSVSALALAVVVAAVRAVRPERLFAPADGADLVEALRAMRLPALEQYPSTWMTDAWMATASGQPGLRPLGRLLFASALAVVVGGAAFAAWQRRGWMRAREAPPPALPGAGLAGRLGRRLCGLLPPPMAAVARLELAAITRDPGQWTQLALLAALAGLYVYNLKLIPGDQRILGPLLTLLNVGVAGLVLSAVALRLGLPSVSRDGPSRWLPEVSPLAPFRRLLAKSLVVGAPLCLLGGGLTAAATLLLNAPGDIQAHAVASVLLMGPALAAIAVGVGARFARYDLSEPAQAAVGSAGLLGFASMLLYVGGMTILTGRPIFGWYARWVGLEVGPLSVAAVALGLQLALSLLLAWAALAWGAKRLERP